MSSFAVHLAVTSVPLETPLSPARPARTSRSTSHLRRAAVSRSRVGHSQRWLPVLPLRQPPEPHMLTCLPADRCFVIAPKTRRGQRPRPNAFATRDSPATPPALGPSSAPPSYDFRQGTPPLAPPPGQPRTPAGGCIVARKRSDVTLVHGAQAGQGGRSGVRAARRRVLRIGVRGSRGARARSGVEEGRRGVPARVGKPGGLGESGGEVGCVLVIAAGDVLLSGPKRAMSAERSKRVSGAARPPAGGVVCTARSDPFAGDQILTSPATPPRPFRSPPAYSDHRSFPRRKSRHPPTACPSRTAAPPPPHTAPLSTPPPQ